MLLCLGEPPRRFLLYLHFIFNLHFVVVVSSFHFGCSFCCHLSIFFIHIFAFQRRPSTFHGLSQGFLHPILYLQPSSSQSDLRHFHFQLFQYLLTERYGFEWAFFTHRCFLPYAPLPTFLTQPAFIKASLGAGSSYLKFAGLHTDPRNTDPAHLFV